LALAGVEVHGHLHRQRLYDGFYRREAILFQVVATLATAMMRYENQDSVIKQVRRLGDLLYPEDPEKKREREEELKDVLRREGAKSYKVMKINLGERRQ
jgi:hypothetical protein